MTHKDIESLTITYIQEINVAHKDIESLTTS